MCERGCIILLRENDLENIILLITKQNDIILKRKTDS